MSSAFVASGIAGSAFAGLAHLDSGSPDIRVEEKDVCEFRRAKKVGVSVKVSSGHIFDIFVRPPKDRDSCQDKTLRHANVGHQFIGRPTLSATRVDAFLVP